MVILHLLTVDLFEILQEVMEQDGAVIVGCQIKSCSDGLHISNLASCRVQHKVRFWLLAELWKKYNYCLTS